MQPMVEPAVANAINRSLRLRATLTSEGWGDVMRISQAIVQEALHNMDVYKGTDDHEIAVLAFVWKTVKEHDLKLRATIADLIKEGDEAQAALTAPKSKLQDTEEQLSGTSVLPLCDMEIKENAEPESE